jgi:FkbM family methyltransferase
MEKNNMDYLEQAKKIKSCTEFNRLKFHEKAGKIEENRQYFFDGSFTTYPWGSEDMHQLMELVKGAGEPQEILPFLNILKSLPEDVITIELGAGWGFYSILVGKRLQKARMVLVEANPRLLEITKTNMERNGLADRSIIIHGAAFNSDGKSVSFIESGYGSSIGDEGDYEVKTVSVDGIIQQFELPKICIIHMDVQGAELEVIKGMLKSLKRRLIDYIFIGTHSNDLHLACEATLNDLGYDTILSLNLDQSVSGDGILVCARLGIGKTLLHSGVRR